MQLLYNRIESQLVLLSFAAVAPTNEPMLSGQINQDHVGMYLTSPKEANEFHIFQRVSTKNRGHQNLKEIPKKSHNLTSIRQDEVIAALAMSDGVVLLVDCVVGLTQYLGFCLEKKCSKFGKTNDQIGQKLTRFR